MVKYYGDDAPFTVNVTAGDEVTFEINGITATVVADGDGIAKIGINLTSGDYLITTTWNNISIVNYILVKSTIVAQDITRGYGSNYEYTIKLLNSTGEHLSNVDVDVVINGKSNRLTADGDGIVHLPSAEAKRQDLAAHLQFQARHTGSEAEGRLPVVQPH